MAAPTPPDIDTLATEGLIKAGYPSPGTAMITRAKDEFMEEVKTDIWLLGKRLKPLQAEHIEVLVGGRSRYNFPAGYSSIVSAKILYGDEENDVTGAAAASVTLDTSNESGGEDDIEGSDILIYSGTGKGSMSQCYSYDTSTYIASVYPAWADTPNATAPVSGDTYVIIDQKIPLKLRSIPNFDEIAMPQVKGPPNYLYQSGDETEYGHYQLYYIPDDTYFYGLHLRYYMNLRTLDLDSTRMATLYARWRNLWIQGVKAKQLEDDDDSRADNEMARYFNMVKDTVSLETYGRNIKEHYTGVTA